MKEKRLEYGSPELIENPLHGYGATDGFGDGTPDIFLDGEGGVYGEQLELDGSHVTS